MLKNLIGALLVSTIHGANARVDANITTYFNKTSEYQTQVEHLGQGINYENYYRSTFTLTSNETDILVCQYTTNGVFTGDGNYNYLVKATAGHIGTNQQYYDLGTPKTFIWMQVNNKTANEAFYLQLNFTNWVTKQNRTINQEWEIYYSTNSDWQQYYMNEAWQSLNFIPDTKTATQNDLFGEWVGNQTRTNNNFIIDEDDWTPLTYTGTFYLLLFMEVQIVGEQTMFLSNDNDIIYYQMNDTSTTRIYVDTTPPSVNYEVIDIPNLMFTILTMPFSFVSQAFNLTLFAGTPYQINVSALFLSIIGILIFIFIIKLIISR